MALIATYYWGVISPGDNELKCLAIFSSNMSKDITEFEICCLENGLKYVINYF